MRADESPTIQLIISCLLFFICSFFVYKGVIKRREDKRDQFCSIVFIFFFATYALNRLIFIFIDLFAFESFILKSHIQNTFALILGIGALLALIAIIRFNDRKFSVGKNQAIIVIVLAMFLSFISIFQAREESSANYRKQRAHSYNKEISYNFPDKNYRFTLPKNSGYKETNELFERVYFSDFTLVESSNTFQFILISEIDEESVDYTTEEYIESVLLDINEKSDSIEIVNTEDVTVDEVPAKRISLLASAKNIPRKVSIVFFTKGNIYYQLATYSSRKNSNIEDLEKQSDIMIKNFSFIKK